jgi:hypothetical protein
MIFKVEQKDIDCDDSQVTERDLGMWVIVLDGLVYGRFEHESDAVLSYHDVWFKHNS